MIETNGEKLARIKKEVMNGWSSSQDTWSYDVEDMKWLVEQVERAEQLISKLHRGLGMSVTIDRQLWLETDRYMKALEGESK